MVFYDDYVRADALFDYVERARSPSTWTSATAWSRRRLGLHDNPKMNQFVPGHASTERNHVAVTFSMKRQKRTKRPRSPR